MGSWNKGLQKRGKVFFIVVSLYDIDHSIRIASMPHILKQLELTGFKSFAQKTTLDFNQGITAIVGPNGSGKTNIVDAILWLLGERDAKNLRGARVEDLIFAGTAKRPRLGRAQASLRFENGHGTFPLEASEVVIRREVDRDGASRYFLNSDEVRLKDMVSFLARGRLGIKGLTVATQGKSDLFLEASPLGRREMIEEVLGLREYRLKKAEAERRLKNAQVNLDKAQALTEEILPHLRSLKRQTSRWEKRDELTRELRELENRFFGSQLAELTAGFREAERAIASHEREYERLRRTHEEAERRLAEIEASEPEERKMLREVRQEIQNALERKNALQKELGRFEARLELACERLQVGNGVSAERLLRTLETVRRELEMCVEENDIEMIRASVQRAIEEIEETLGEIRRGTRIETRTSAGVTKELTRLEEALSRLSSELDALRRREKELEERQASFYASFKEAVGKLEEAKDAREQWGIRHRELLFSKERIQLRREELERQAAQAGRRLDEFEEAPVGKGGADDRTQVERRMFKLRGDLASIGEVDEAVVREAKATEERCEFLKREIQDLLKARTDLTSLIRELNNKINKEFSSAFKRIDEEFNSFIGLMFNGGQARLCLTKSEGRRGKSPRAAAEAEGETKEEEASAGQLDVKEKENEEEGIEIDVRLPRKRITSLEMLSGGERSLVGIAALFALVSVSPPPFLVLDEIDAALDDRNAKRFADLLKEFSKKTQFVVVTHNRATMEAADVLYGVTLNDDGTSKIVSLKLETSDSNKK